jgi:hypothetical protein
MTRTAGDVLAIASLCAKVAVDKTVNKINM